MTLTPVDQNLVAQLAAIVGGENLLVSDQDRVAYGLDWTRFYEPDPAIIVTPRHVDQVIALVKWANREQRALVPSGGRTGLSGGAVATRQEVVVSFDKMNRVIDFDDTDGVVVVEPGVITAALQAYAQDKGWFYPVDFASSGSSQIGGNIATNAGGIKVLRYGMTRDQISGIMVVTGLGDLLDLNKGLVKNATGYDFRHLFIGSEGTLGFIVEATIQLIRPPLELTVALLAVPRMVDVMSVLKVFREYMHLTAFEFFSDKALAHVMRHHGVAAPLGAPAEFYALIEFENAHAEDMDRAMAAFEVCVAEGIATDGVLSQSEQQRRQLWKYREYVSESISSFTPYKNDIAVRVGKVPALLDAIETKVGARYPEFEIVWFGHIGDGNVHLNILKPAAWEVSDFKKECERVSEEILAIVARMGGSISAEHGVGLLKRDQLGFSRSPTEIALMRDIKAIFDPNGIMNPGKLLA